MSIGPFFACFDPWFDHLSIAGPDCHSYRRDRSVLLSVACRPHRVLNVSLREHLPNSFSRRATAGTSACLSSARRLSSARSGRTPGRTTSPRFILRWSYATAELTVPVGIADACWIYCCYRFRCPSRSARARFVWSALRLGHQRVARTVLGGAHFVFTRFCAGHNAHGCVSLGTPIGFEIASIFVALLRFSWD